MPAICEKQEDCQRPAGHGGKAVCDAGNDLPVEPNSCIRRAIEKAKKKFDCDSKG